MHTIVYYFYCQYLFWYINPWSVSPVFVKRSNLVITVPVDAPAPNLVITITADVLALNLVITVPADTLAPNGTRASAGTVMTIQLAPFPHLYSPISFRVASLTLGMVAPMTMKLSWRKYINWLVTTHNKRQSTSIFFNVLTRASSVT